MTNYYSTYQKQIVFDRRGGIPYSLIQEDVHPLGAAFIPHGSCAKPKGRLNPENPTRFRAKDKRCEPTTSLLFKTLFLPGAPSFATSLFGWVEHALLRKTRLTASHQYGKDDRLLIDVICEELLGLDKALVHPESCSIESDLQQQTSIRSVDSSEINTVSKHAEIKRQNRTSDGTSYRARRDVIHRRVKPHVARNRSKLSK